MWEKVIILFSDCEIIASKNITKHFLHLWIEGTPSNFVIKPSRQRDEALTELHLYENCMILSLTVLSQYARVTLTDDEVRHTDRRQMG